MTQFGAISYAIVGVFYAILVLLLAVSWRGRKLGGYLIAACVVSVVWGALLAWDSSDQFDSEVLIFGVEVLRGGAWLTFLTAIGARIGVNRLMLYGLNLLWIGVLAAGAVFWLGREFVDPALSLVTVLIPGGLAIALAGLFLIEQLYRNLPPGQRWGFKAIALGLGGIFAYDLFLYSQGVLFNALDATTWVARGAVNCLFVPLIAISARRSPDWDLNIFVSRQVVFYSTTLVAVGAYLVVMSLGGYALLLYGGTWGDLARIIFFAGAILVLAVLLFSSVLRARVKVFIAKHFYHNKYDYRDEWLRLVSTLSGIGETSSKEVAIRAAAQIVESPAGALWVLDETDRAFKFAAAHDVDRQLPDIDDDSALVEFIRKEGWLVDLEELRHKPDMYGGLELPDWLAGQSNAWLIVPMFTSQRLIGMIMLTKAPGPPVLNYEDRDLLKTVGNHIAVHLVQEKADRQLAEAQQFEAYNRLTAFLMHDLNNLIAQQSLIVSNAEKHKRNPEFVDDAIQTIAGSVERLKRVMRQLKRGGSGRQTKLTDLKFLVSAAVDQCSSVAPIPTLELNGVEASVNVNAEEFTMVLAHLIRNAQDATPPDGSVSVSVDKNRDRASIRISDTGVGMPEEFIRERLFRPFDSTKGSRGMGIGAYQAREFVRGIGGDISVESEVSKGTTITIALDLAD